MSQADDSPSQQDFEAFYRDAYASDVEAFLDEYGGNGTPGKGALRIDWQALDDHDPNLADAVLKFPEQSVMPFDGRSRTPVAVDALEAHAGRSLPGARVRIHNLPDRETYRVGDLRTRHLSGLVAVRGTVAKAHPVEPLLVAGVFTCQRCGAETEFPQGYGEIQEPVTECLNCENDGPWHLDRHRSSLVDFQCVSLMPADSNLDDPPIVPAYLKTDLCDRVGKDDDVTVVGVYDTMPLELQKEVQLNVFVEASEVDQETATQRDKLTKEELREKIVRIVETRSERGSSFGADRAAVVDDIVSEGVREEEVEDCIEELVDDTELGDAGSGKLMVR